MILPGTQTVVLHNEHTWNHQHQFPFEMSSEDWKNACMGISWTVGAIPRRGAIRVQLREDLK